MTFTHSFFDVTPPARFDGVSWLTVRPYFATTISGSYTALTPTVLTSDPTPMTPNPVNITVTDAPEAVGWFAFEWDVSPTNPSPKSPPILSPASSLVTDPTWAPTTSDVADLLYTRTKDRGGKYLGVFTDQTNPTDIRAGHLINVAQDKVISDIGGNPPDTLPVKQRNARGLTTIYAAMLIELSHYSEQITRDISPYKELRKLYEAGLTQLEDETPVDAGKGALDSAGNPNYHFDGFSVGYKAW